MPFWRYASGHQTIDSPDAEDRLDIPVADHVHVDERRVRAEHAQLPQIDEARPPPAPLHGGRHVEVVAEVGVQDDALAIGERLGRA